MAKKYGFNPYVILSGGLGDGGDDTVTGGGSGQGGIEPIEGGYGGLSILMPMSFDDWSQKFAADFDGNGETNFRDYMLWWSDNGFAMDAWAEFNPNVAFSLDPEVDA